MSLILSGTDGLSDVDGSAATPAIRGTDANTGIFFPAADTIAFSEGGTEAMRITDAGNVGVGTASPPSFTNFRYLSINGTTGAVLNFKSNEVSQFEINTTGSLNNITGLTNIPLTFGTNNTERMRIDTNGSLLVGATGSVNNERLRVDANITSFGTRLLNSNANPQGVTVGFTGAAPNGTGNPFIACGDTATDRFIARSNGGLANYSANNVNLASDLRLKHDIEPVQSYWNVFKSIEWKTWLYNDQTDEIKNIGVIAQELQALAPELVCESNALPTPEGESPYLGLWENDFKMDGMSVITELVKRCEEQQSIITSLTDRITALEAK